MFQIMDVDDSRCVTFMEWKAGLAMYGANMAEDDMRVLMAAQDMDTSELLNYKEFIGTAITMYHSHKEESLFQAFQHFDDDSSGYAC